MVVRISGNSGVKDTISIQVVFASKDTTARESSSVTIKFYTPCQNFLKICEDIRKITLSLHEGAGQNKMFIITKGTNGSVKGKSKSYTFYTKYTHSELSKIIKDELKDAGHVVEFECNHSIHIRNNYSIGNDNRTFSLFSDLEFEKLYSYVKDIYEKSKSKCTDDIVFITDHHNKASHYLLVSKRNKHDIEKTKSFAIDLHNYSSDEVSNMLIDEILIAEGYINENDTKSKDDNFTIVQHCIGDFNNNNN